MDELEAIDNLCDALSDDTWTLLRVLDDRGRPQDITRLDAIDYLATLAPELTLPPSTLH